MKKLTLIMVLCALCLSAFGCSESTDGGDTTTSGVTEKAPESAVQLEDPTVVTDDQGIVYKEKYDENKRVISRFCIDADSGLYGSRIDYAYNAQGLVFVESRYAVNGTLTYRDTFEYNEKGIKIKATRTGEDNSVMQETLYTDSGKVLKDTSYSNNGNVSGVIEFEYNDADVCVREKHTYVAVGAGDEKIYNDSGVLQESITYGAKGVVVEKRKYEYADNGQLNRVLRYDAKDTVLDQEVYYYDAEGKLEKTVKYDANGYEI